MDIERISNSPYVGCSPACAFPNRAFAVCNVLCKQKESPQKIDSECPAHRVLQGLRLVEGRLPSLIS